MLTPRRLVNRIFYLDVKKSILIVSAEDFS